MIGRSSEVVIHDSIGRERERHKVPYGAVLLVQDGAAVRQSSFSATWDRILAPWLPEHAGTVKFENVERRNRCQTNRWNHRFIHFSGDWWYAIASSASKLATPTVKLLNENGEEVTILVQNCVSMAFKWAAIIAMRRGQVVGKGDVLARIPQLSSKTATLRVVFCRAWQSVGACA